MFKNLQSVILLFGLITQLFYSCSNKQDEVVPQREEIPLIEQPGYFEISPNVYATSSANTRIAGTNINTQFDLGALKASKEYLFMVANGGGEPIFDITLTSDNLPFEVSPKSIQILPGKNQGGIMPLITVGVIHGKMINGVGPAPNLTKGVHSATIKMRGKTLSSQDKAGNTLAKKDTIEVVGEFVVKVEAKVVDAKILSGGVEAVTAVNELNSIPYLKVEPSKTVKMVNTGNVTIEATISYNKAVAEPNQYSAIGVSYTYSSINNKITLIPEQEVDITNFISPKTGQQAEGNLLIEYSSTSVAIDTKGIVYNVNGFSMKSE